MQGQPRILEDLFGPPISVYTREQALEDGVLIDVTEMAREAGLKFPVAVTARLHGERVTPSAIEQKHGQDHAGRLWDTLWMLRCAILAGDGGEVVRYKVIYATAIPGKDDRLKQEIVTLRAVCGPGDDAEPVITIMLPDED